MKKLENIMKNQFNHHLYPFFWQKGQSKEVLKDYLDHMEEGGIHNFCVESRPHPEFLKEGWWDTMDFLIAEAKERDMHMWILDDAKFPTGYANGKVPQEYKKRYLNYHRFDFIGTSRLMTINLSMLYHFRELRNPLHQYDHIFKAILVENETSDYNAFNETSLKDVTASINDKEIRLTLEKKHYSLFVIYETSVSQEDTTKDYLDPMRKEATQILLNEVYEKHYEHYHDEFGKTIQGFFSDEPRFGNAKGATHIIGKSDMPLPYNDNVKKALDQVINPEEYVFLFKGESPRAHEVRYAYMNIVSKLYQENFTSVISSWCHEHGVIYVGHVIEDNGAHARLGYGPGHYFRAINAQDMAGIDVIGGQVVPGMSYHHDAYSTGGSDGEFYHYGLVQMGASAAKLDANKKGRLMCEAFGAYGWVEGLKMMTWITNHLISHGVNTIVPHAFDPAKFPDWDCPPHFYAHGMNPQYQYFDQWSSYADRLCELVSDGYHQAHIGILYHASAEWSGEAMPFQKVTRVLEEHQIASDIISEDYLEACHLDENGYTINNYSYRVLVVPEAVRLPQHLIDKLAQVSRYARVIYINTLPSQTNGEVLALNQLAQALYAYREIETSHDVPELSFYHYVHKDGDVYLFNHEGVLEDIDTDITLPEGTYQIYDAFTNNTYELNTHSFHLHLKPYEMLVVVSGKSDNPLPILTQETLRISKVDQISLKSYDHPVFKEIEEKELIDLSVTYPQFSGTIRYEFDIDLNKEKYLKIDEVYEIVHVEVNGMECDTRIAPQYIFDIEKAKQQGHNHIVIDVINNLSRALRDPFSVYIPLEPLGIISQITFYQ